MSKQPTSLTFSAGKAKAEQYCAYQERSQQEVRDKLYGWGLHFQEVENILVELIMEGFLNEERFALAYAGGKHRLKKWGKFKIKQGLKQKSVSDPIIKTALASIDPDDYFANLTELLAKKASSLPETDPYRRRVRLVNYALSRGYEQHLIFEILKDNELQ